jgi:hypothetical protein
MGTASLKAFISYSTDDKNVGAGIKAALDDLGIESFLAHNDLRVSEEWRNRISQELEECEVFIPLLSKSFSQSKWCDQETGTIIHRKSVLIIPLSIDGTVPYGFISHIQSHKIPANGISTEIIRNAIGAKFPSIIIDLLPKGVHRVYTFRAAEAAVAPLVPYFDKLSKPQAHEFAEQAIENGQIWAAHLCREEYLPKFLALNKAKLPVRIYRAIKYQVDRQEWYANRSL